MKTQRSRVTAFIGLLALTAGSVPAPVWAQEKRIEATKPDGGITIVKSGDNQGLKPSDISVFFDGEEHAATVKFLETRLAFDKLVKGAAYSATAVTETTQTLSDGNRITRKREVTLYRDSEGRTRREQPMEGVKPSPAAGDPPRTIFINDPIGGYNYVLDPRTKTARKTRVAGFGRLGNERESARERVDLELKRLETKRNPTEPGTSPAPPRITTLRDGNRTESSIFLKGPVSGGLRNMSWDNNLLEAAVTIVQPDYEGVVKQTGVQGSVRIRFVVAETGVVESVTVEDGDSRFREPALAAARQFRFRPLVRDGKATRNHGTVTFRFTLPGAKAPAPPGRPLKVEPASQGGDATRPLKIAPAAKTDGAKKTESLGKQTIEGVEAEGTRSTFTIPAGEIGNQLPIEITDERWYSPELQTLVMSKHHDPRSGETVYRLSNIRRSEPDHSLFEIPSDYTLDDPMKPRPTERIKKPESETDEL